MTQILYSFCNTKKNTERIPSNASWSCLSNHGLVRLPQTSIKRSCLSLQSLKQFQPRQSLLKQKRMRSPHESRSWSESALQRERAMIVRRNADFKWHIWRCILAYILCFLFFSTSPRKPGKLQPCIVVNCKRLQVQAVHVMPCHDAKRLILDRSKQTAHAQLMILILWCDILSLLMGVLILELFSIPNIYIRRMRYSKLNDAHEKSKGMNALCTHDIHTWVVTLCTTI